MSDDVAELMRKGPILAWLSRFGLRITLATMILGGLAWWGTTGIWIVDPSEEGVVLRFGKLSRVVPPGMHFTLPAPIETVTLVRTAENRQMPVGFKFRDLDKGIPPSDDELHWLTGDTNIVELRAIVQYDIKDPVDYVFRVAHLSDGSPKDFILRKVTEAVMTSLLSMTSIDVVLLGGKAILERAARVEVQRLVDDMSLGLGIQAINIIDAAAPAAVIGAFNEVVSAESDREKGIDEAMGYRLDLLPKKEAQANTTKQKAEIYADEVVNKARGEANRFIALAEKIRESPDITRKRLWLDQIVEVFSTAKVRVYESKEGSTFRYTIFE